MHHPLLISIYGVCVCVCVRQWFGANFFQIISDESNNCEILNQSYPINSPNHQNKKVEVVKCEIENVKLNKEITICLSKVF